MSQQSAPRGSGGFRPTPKLIVSIVLLALLAIFIVQNAQEVDVDLLFWDVRMRLAFALLLAALGGMIIGWLVPRFRSGSRR